MWHVSKHALILTLEAVFILGCAPQSISFVRGRTVTNSPTSGLSYGQTSMLLGVGITAPNILVLTATGNPTGFTVSPGLPLGLTLDSVTGTISGKPLSVTTKTSYAITAHGLKDETTTLSLRVMHPTNEFNSGYSNLMFLRSNGSVWAWGEANAGRNGTSETLNPQPSLYAMPAAVASNVTQVSAADTSCVLINDTMIRCTGKNDKGQVGCASCSDGVDRGTFQDVQPPAGGWGTAFHVGMIASGPFHSCAIIDEGGVIGKIYCWGHNEAGQLGFGGADTSIHSIPTHVQLSGGSTLTGATWISVGNDTTCAVSSGVAYCWGSNNQSQIGSTIASNPQLTPLTPTGLTSGVTQITTTTYFDYGNTKHTCAIVNGGAKCWGSNYFKQIGNAAASDPQITPLSVTNLSSGVELIRAQAGGSCAIQAGRLYCWGNQDKGRLFNGLSDSTPAASQVTPQAASLGVNIASFAMGEFHTCALLVTGELKCVGSNFAGMHGDNTVDSGGWPGLSHLTPSLGLDSFL